MLLSELPIEQQRKIALDAISPESKRRFLEFHGRQRCIERAMAKPLPGASAAAFTKGEINAADKIVNRVVPAHFAVLQALDSPLLKMIEQATTKTKADVDFTAEQRWQVCYVFTEDAKTIYKALKSKGADFIREQSENVVMATWDEAQINLVMIAVLEQIKRHIQTTVKFAGEMKERGDVSFFQEQPESR